MNHPHSFTGNPFDRPHHPAPTAAQEPAVAYVPPVVAVDARLTVRASGNVTLAKGLLLAIPHLKRHAPVDLVPPLRRGGTWHLDTRPTAARRLSHTETERGSVARFEIRPPSPQHFLKTVVQSEPGRFGGARGTAPVAALVFALGHEVAGHPGYFELLPVR
jgi:hypothetical protein